MKNTTSNPVLSSDILRYKKNKFGANLALLAIVCDCIYFIFLYAVADEAGRAYYSNWAIAFDVIFNLVFLLLTFLLSEQVKNYNSKLCILQIVLGALQIGRIFWLPLGGITNSAITTGKFLVLTISLAASGALEIASAVIGYIRSKQVAEFTKKVEAGEVDVMETIRELDAEEAQSAPEVAEEAQKEVQ